LCGELNKEAAGKEHPEKLNRSASAGKISGGLMGTIPAGR
jgi:hypothetical protein